MYSLREIVRSTKQFVEDHKQLNSFHFGFLDEAVSTKGRAFPILVCTVESKSVEEYKDSFNFSIYVADQVREFKNVEDIGIGDELEVQNQTELICQDYIEYFKNRFPGLSLQDPTNLEPFSYRKDAHNLAGWQITASFQQHNERNYCQVPIDDNAVPDNNRYAVVYDIESGDELYQLYPGNSLGVLQFSGISGGSASTTFTNSIVSP